MEATNDNTEAAFPLIVKDSQIHGKGLYAGSDIPWGVKIIEYQGEIIDDREAERRIEQGAGYIFELGTDTNIDGEANGNDARFVNHSRQNPNCVILRENNRIWIVAGIEGVSTGEELTFDYGSDYYSDSDE
jgi:SET domain-containing protein